jgi:hypothetical protein
MDTVFLTLTEEGEVDMAAIAMKNENHVITAITSLHLRVLVKHLLQPCQSKLMTCPSIW